MASVERDQLPTRDNPRDRADYRECDRSHRDGATIVCLRASAIRLVRPSATPTFERGKERLRDITKQGDPYIRKLLIIGATAVLRFSRHRAPAADWTSGLFGKTPTACRRCSARQQDGSYRMGYSDERRSVSSRTRSCLMKTRKRFRDG